MSSLSKLQSDVLEQKYGSIYAEVLTHSKHIREVFLLDQKRIKREYAVTFFPDKVDRALLQVNKKIKNGGLIGKTFRDNGYNIIKTKKQVLIANYPFATIDPNVGVVLVPDERVDKLAELSRSAKKIYATVDFVDIAGLVKGASEGEGLGNKFLANIRETDAIVYVLRAFKNPDIINTQTEIDPLKDKEILDVELILKDLETVNKRVDGLAGDVRAGKKEAVKEMSALTKAKEFLSQQKVLIDQNWTEEENLIVRQYQLLTFKPRLYLLNGKPEDCLTYDVKQFKSYVILDIAAEYESEGLNKEERIG